MLSTNYCSSSTDNNSIDQHTVSDGWEIEPLNEVSFTEDIPAPDSPHSVDTTQFDPDIKRNEADQSSEPNDTHSVSDIESDTTSTDVITLDNDSVELDVAEYRGCSTNLDCDDKNLCTMDRCAETQNCVWEYILCEDNSLCTIDGCEPKQGCVFLVNQCGSANPCELSYCSDATGQCVSMTMDCDDQNPCTLDSCSLQSGCYHVASLETPCCLTSSDCPQTRCTQGDCVDGVCLLTSKPLAECCSGKLLDESFNDGVANGFVWAANSSTVGWTIYPGALYCSTPCLYFGDPSGPNYVGGPWVDSIISPEVTLPAEVQSTLSFSLYMGTEASPLFDSLMVDLIDANETSYTVWEKKHDLNDTFTWNTYQIDLTPVAGSSIRVRWTFSTADAKSNFGPGVFVDDIQITSTCNPSACKDDNNCKSDIPAYQGACENEACNYVPNPDTCSVDAECALTEKCTGSACIDGYCTAVGVADCCTSAAACLDMDPCTEDICMLESGQCAHPSSWLCCYVDADCNDGNPCTKDSCPSPLTQCVHQQVENCCFSDAQCPEITACSSWSCILNKCTETKICCDTDQDCNDSQPCSTDVCLENQCFHWDTDPVIPCCNPLVFMDEFSTDTTGLWKTVIDSVPDDDIDWHTTNQMFLSPPAALALFSLSSGTYASSVPIHLALESSPIFIPPNATLSFWLHLTNEFSGGVSAAIQYDVLSVVVVDDSQEKLLWTSSQPLSPWWKAGGVTGISGPNWSHVGGLSLAPYAKKFIGLKLVFETFDAAHNLFPGPIIDDLRIEAPCSN